MRLSSIMVIRGVSWNAAEIAEVCRNPENLSEENLETVAQAFEKMAKLVRDTKIQEAINNHQKGSVL